ncbi:MAG: AAA family ATPase [Deltaproteobacteria bacterium]|nr:AAA family ATPase [Deltaproteobacteria bacterium]MBW2019276.1 AAA family ATPase [Deltaproteobacteria bacterium]MBW2074103.1 AAA family ATPase [Deltaproteobacteria bacterium]RLB82568.1 MAG: ATPase [Deltaproteobacteria bacterium]
MYTDFFELKEKPFKLTPDPKFLFLSETHLEALNHLIYGIKNREGFILITGDVGSGKTTICRVLLEKMGPDTNTALIFNPMLSEEELLCAILQDFGVAYRGTTKKELVDELNAFLLKQLEEGKNVVLIVDEAQDLTISLLEQIRLLSNLETEKEKLIQIVLFGQNELKGKLNLPALRQLNQRIAIRYELRYLNREETEKYIYYRLTIAGSDGRVVFTPSALNRIFKYSKGVPRLINIVSDRALLSAYMQLTNKITKKLVERGIKSLEATERTFPRRKWITVAVLSILVTLFSLFLVFRMTAGLK